MFAFCSPMICCMGYSRRRENKEILEAIERADRYILNMTLGGLCASGVVMLPVACYQCQRQGRYRVTRLIDLHGARTKLPDVKRLLAGDCANPGTPFFKRCGAYFPGIIPNKVDGRL